MIRSNSVPKDSHRDLVSDKVFVESEFFSDSPPKCTKAAESVASGNLGVNLGCDKGINDELPNGMNGKSCDSRHKPHSAVRSVEKSGKG